MDSLRRRALHVHRAYGDHTMRNGLSTESQSFKNGPPICHVTLFDSTGTVRSAAHHQKIRCCFENALHQIFITHFNVNLIFPFMKRFFYYQHLLISKMSISVSDIARHPDGSVRYDACMSIKKWWLEDRDRVSYKEHSIQSKNDDIERFKSTNGQGFLNVIWWQIWWVRMSYAIRNNSTTI